MSIVRSRDRLLSPEGFTLVEVLLASTLAFVLAAGAGSLITIHARGSLETAAQADRLDAARVVRGVLENELESGVEGRDWKLFDGDSLTLRSYRGVAISCGPAAGGVVRVLVRGERGTEPAKDSVLVLTPEGRWTALDLESATAMGSGSGSASTAVGGCWLPGPAWTSEEWTISGPDEGFVVARIFERGSYHLVDEAFRYRSGRGGRQPLTLALFDSRQSGLDPGASAPTVLRMRLGFRDSPGTERPPGRRMNLWMSRP